ncbi:hypothetical protein [Caballeronia sp. TF1N1]|uniref:hypothetical protein n=1 Tax=Caballeronia sp. TF1N1 TaxID=2878153 RepID=UPI001FD3B8E1|nr:hypothetical protein [Caballeronia sp. TF1N1]
MTAFSYTNVKDLTALPSFHDAELFAVLHDPDAKTLLLDFKRASGPIETLLFSGIIGQRLIDFADQNVASRLLVSPEHKFSVEDVRKWVCWISSRDDAQARELDFAFAERLFLDIREGTKALFILEPSCGAEMAVLCESIALRMPHESS